MVAKILLYLGTIFITEWIIMLVGIIPSLFLGLLNNATGGKFPPYHPLFFGLRTTPAIGVLFLADWIWEIVAGQHIALIVIPILVAIHIKSMKAPGANAANIHQAQTAIAGILIFIPCHIALIGISNINWW